MNKLVISLISAAALVASGSAIAGKDAAGPTAQAAGAVVAINSLVVALQARAATRGITISNIVKTKTSSGNTQVSLTAPGIGNYVFTDNGNGTISWTSDAEGSGTMNISDL